MKITDEKLSAFLDAELPEKEMAEIRNAITTDEALATRIASLAMADDVVKTTYSKIDARPMPASITAMLSADQPQQTAEIINFPWWRQVQRGIQQHAIAAACATLFIGFLAGRLPSSLTESTASDPQWSQVAKVLEEGRSGVALALQSGATVQPKVTFKDKKGQYCRLFNVNDKLTASENIACRDKMSWQLVATVRLEKIVVSDHYQTATAQIALDSAMAQMIEGEFLNASSEKAIINNGWSIK